MEDQLSGIALTWAATGNKPSFESTGSRASTGIYVLKPTNEMKSQFTRNMGGSRTIVKAM